MSAFSYYNILKSNAKNQAHAQGIKLSEALELIAKQAKFTHFHELSVVAKCSPLDSRLMAAALGVTDLRDALYENNVYAELELVLEDQLSGVIAETNASGFSMEILEVTATDYDELTGVLTLDVSLTYKGEQDPDRVYSGSAFYLDTVVRIVRRNNEWALAEDGLEIIKEESDQDRDWAMEQKQWAEEQSLSSDDGPSLSLDQKLADKLGITVQEAGELVDADILTNDSDDGLIYSYIFDFDSVVTEPLRSKLIKVHGSLQLEVSPNFFE